MKAINEAVRRWYYASENKNNDQATNGEFWLMKKLAEAGVNVIFDGGANIGKWSLEADKLFNNGKIYAFEPMPEVFKKLQENVAGRSNINIFPLALSNQKGTLTFNYYPNQILFSSIYTHFSAREAQAVNVTAIDGDSFCVENNISEIDFLKLDVEGAEHLVLKGFKKMLEAQKIRVIQFEYGIVSIDSKFLLKDYFDLLTPFGYVLGKIYPNYVDFSPYHWTAENFIGPNYVAVRKSDLTLINALS